MSFVDNALRLGIKAVLALLIIYPVIPSALMLYGVPSKGVPLVVAAVVMGLERLDSGGQLGVGPFILRALVLMMAAAWCMRPVVNPLRRPAFLRPMLGFLAVALLSALTSSAPHDALLAVVDSFCLIALVVLICQDDYDFPIKGIGALLVVTALLTIPADVYQYFINEAGDGQMRGSFYHPTMMANYMALSFPMALLFFVRDPDELSRSRGARPLVAGLASAALLYCIYAGVSRAVIMVVALQVCLLLAWQPLLMVAMADRPGRSTWIRRALLALSAWVVWMVLSRLAFRIVPPAAAATVGLVVGVLVAVGVLVRAYPSPGRRAVAIFLLMLLPWLAVDRGGGVRQSAIAVKTTRMVSGDDSSVSSRLVFWKAGWEIFLSHPLLGIGPAGFHRYYPAYQVEERWFSKFCHNQLLTVLCETGAPATGLMLWGLFLLLRDCLRRIRAENDQTLAQMRLAALLGALSVGLCSLTDVQFIFPILPMLAAVLLGLCLSDELPEEIEQPQTDNPWAVRPYVLGRHAVGAMLVAVSGINVIWSQAELFAIVARNAAQQGKFEDAATFIRQACRLDPWQGENFRALGLNLVTRAGSLKPEEKKELLSSAWLAVRLDSHRAVCYDLLSKAYLINGNSAAATEAARHALECDPINYPAFYQQLFVALNGISQPDEAQLVLLACADRFPLAANKDMFDFRSKAVTDQLAPVFRQLAENADPTRHPVESAHWYERALALAPNNWADYLGLGVAEYMQRKFETARTDLEKSRDLNPKMGTTYRILGQVYRALGKPKEAAAADQAGKEADAHPAPAPPPPPPPRADASAAGTAPGAPDASDLAAPPAVKPAAPMPTASPSPPGLSTLLPPVAGNESSRK